MKKPLIRNDDVGLDTNVEHLKEFCELCDKYNFKIIQGITPIGRVLSSHAVMSDDEIIRDCGTDTIFQNTELIDYLKSRDDIMAVHGLMHTHRQTEDDVLTAKDIIYILFREPEYFIPPFNEGVWGDKFCGLKVSQLNLENGDRVEDYLRGENIPEKDIMYLHSWRFFDNNWYNINQLEELFKRWP